jgi:hypothetical protein
MITCVTSLATRYHNHYGDQTWRQSRLLRPTGFVCLFWSLRARVREGVCACEGAEE